MPDKDPARMQETRTSTEKDVDFRIRLEAYFGQSVGTYVERLQNFAKYVPRQTLTRFLAKHEIFKRILTIQGSIVECGVFLGGGLMSFAQLSAILEPLNHQRKIIGFDTFSGFTELSNKDQTARSEHAKQGALASDAYEDLKTCIELYDLNRFIGHIPKVTLVKGDIRVTLPKYLQDNPHTVVSLLYLDLDIFEPTKAAIENLACRMPKGSVIAFDQLNADNWPGETLAVFETIGITNLRIERFAFDTFISYAVIE